MYLQSVFVLVGANARLFIMCKMSLKIPKEVPVIGIRKSKKNRQHNVIYVIMSFVISA